MRTASTHLPPLLRTAWKRRPPRRARLAEGGGGSEKSQNNFIAEAPKKRAGARPGNRNALRHGVHAGDSRARRAALKRLAARAESLAQAALSGPAGLDRAAQAALLALLAEGFDG